MTLMMDDEPRARGGSSGGAHLIVVLEGDRPLAQPSRHSIAETDVVVVGRGATRVAERSADARDSILTVQIPDPHMSTIHFRIVRGPGCRMLRDASSRNGTIHNGAPCDVVPLSDGDVIEAGRTVFVFREDWPLAELDQGPVEREGFETIVPRVAEQLDMLAKIARTSVCVLLQGETGTGKEVMARILHRLSGRSGPMVSLNCGAIPANLVETELFGYRKGAFSGAVEDRLGVIRSAHLGTLFLDEVGDLPLPSQAAFLRVLQEREVQPVGATRSVPVDLRVVAASHRALPELVGQHSFRADLLGRISGVTLSLPPLRERREDMGLLVAALARRHAPHAAERIKLSARASRALMRYSWPLNVRELEKCLEAALVLSELGTIEVEHLPEVVRAALEEAPAGTPAETAPSSTTATAPKERPEPLSEADVQLRERLVSMLVEHDGNLSAVARAMDKARNQIQRWIRRLGIAPDEYMRPPV